LEQLKSLQTTREQLSTNLEALQSSNTTLRSTTERQADLIRWANEVLSEGWGIALKDRATWAKFQDFGQHTLDFRIASTRYLPEWQVDPDPVLLPNEKAGITYEGDMLRALRQMSKKTSEDVMNDVIERQVRNGAISESEASDWRKKLLPLVHAEPIYQDTSDPKSAHTNR
jgi:hypothetical protein